MPAAPPELVFIDTETTGLDPVHDHIIELGAVRTDARLAVVQRFSQLVDPGTPVPLYVQRLTGITDESLAGAPNFADAYPKLCAFAGDATLVGQNLPFDLERLALEARRAGLPPLANSTFDTLEAALLLFPELDRHALHLMAEHLGVPGGAHRALQDAEVTVALFTALCRRAASLAPQERRLLQACAWPPLKLLDRFQAKPVKTPPLVAEEPPGGAAPLSMLPCAEDAWQAELGKADVEADGEAGGKGNAAPLPGLAVRLAGFRHRPGQVDLAAQTAAVLRDGGIGLFEAGTGMGKSLAYLLPAAFFSAARGERVVVSTKTKALQRQLAAHELPLVEAALPPGWRWALLMGRENYLCRRQLEEALDDADKRLPDAERALALAYLVGRARWGEVDLSALPYRAAKVLPALRDLARELRSSTATCLGRRCPARARCHWRLARARAERAHLVCVNHALLLTARDALPPFEHAIIDEAHLLPDEAMSAFSQVLSRQTVDDLTSDLRGRHGQRSLAARLRAAERTAEAGTSPVLRAAAAHCERAVSHLPQYASDVGAALQRLLDAVAADDDEGRGGRGSPRSRSRTEDEYNRTVWLTPGLRERPEWDRFVEASATLAQGLVALAQAASQAAAALPEQHGDAAAVRTLADEAQQAAELARTIPESTGPDHVVWGEIDAAGRWAAAPGSPASPLRWTLTRAPLTPAAHVRSALWDQLRAVVLTSATLTATSSFAYFRLMAGLSRDLDVVERIMPSPFDYRRQAVLVLEHDPQAAFAPDKLASRQAQRLKSLTQVTGGRMLALFTNKRDMQRVAAEVGEHAEQDGVVLLAQGLHGSAAALAEEFRSHPSTVLLGVDSLWTGQDFPGDALVCLVIAKLPFPRQDPLFQARRRAAIEEGRDWFRAFYLPEAVLRFRQGFGRLIRTETDSGVVVVLDHRLPQSNYERDFLASLPDLKVVRAGPDQLAAVVAHHLERLARESGQG
jgi:DNA polymerase III epsilon subunit family exonuclease